ncbi:tetratricopeptide repeat protein [Virgibacillus oceani]
MSKGKFMNIVLTDKVDTMENQVSWLNTDSSVSRTEEYRNIENKIEKDKFSADLRVEKGLELCKSMLFKEAIDAYSEAISLDPFHALAYRHRGHRYLSIRMYNEAAADFELSSRLDPTNWDTWYHLGLSYYLLREFDRAEWVYKICHDMTNTDELFVAIADWYWMTLMQNGKTETAEKLLSNVSTEMDAGPNTSYYRRLLMYKSLIDPEELIQYDGAKLPDLELATQGYGLGFYYLVQGDSKKGKETFQNIIEKSSLWSAFGYLAAEEELKHL